MTAKSHLLLYYCLVGLALILIALQRSSAAVFVIPDGDVAALINALNTANVNGEDDTIELAPDGQYTLMGPADTCYNTGLPVLLTDGGRIVTIHGNDARISRDDQNPTTFGIFAVFGATTISDVTIRGGYSSQTQPCGASGPSGAAIYMHYATVHLRHCVFEENTSAGGLGGAIYNWGGSLTISDSVFSDNHSVNGEGGAINSEYGATLTVLRCTFRNNTAQLGGAISITGNLIVQQTIARVSDSTFVQNVALGSGGAIANSGHTSFALQHSTLNGNTASSGGAIYNNGFILADLTVDLCTFAGNSAINGCGGGIYNFGGNDGTPNVNTMIHVTNSIFSNNSASSHGGGICNDRSVIGSNSASATVANTLFKSGAAGETLYNAAGTITSLGYNLTDDGGGGFLTAMGDQIFSDPLLDPAGLQDNGGPTHTIALLPGSPAINAGDLNAPARDQRYYSRNGVSDIGAFEYGGTLLPLTAASRKMHGAAGDFDIDLPLNANAGVECRSGGAHGDYQVVVDFATPVMAASTSVTSGTGKATLQSVIGSQVKVDLTGVSNAQRIVLTISGVSDGANTNDVNIPMSILLGDTDGNGVANSSDVAQTKGQSGQAVTSSNFRNDVNANGIINASDVASVKLQVGTSFPTR